jgi:hypothetical protein
MKFFEISFCRFCNFEIFDFANFTFCISLRSARPLFRADTEIIHKKSLCDLCETLNRKVSHGQSAASPSCPELAPALAIMLQRSIARCGPGEV